MSRPLLVGVVVGVTVFGAVTASGGDDDAPKAGRAAAPATAAADASSGRAVFAREGCGSCHSFAAAGATGTLAPNLDTELAGYTAADVKAKILDPGAENIMPKDFGKRIDADELDALVSFLLAERRS